MEQLLVDHTAPKSHVISVQFMPLDNGGIVGIAARPFQLFPYHTLQSQPEPPVEASVVK